MEMEMDEDKSPRQKRRGRGEGPSRSGSSRETSPSRSTGVPRNEGSSFARSTVSQRPPRPVGLPGANEFQSGITNVNPSFNARGKSLRPITEALGTYEGSKTRGNLDTVANAIGGLKPSKREKYGSVVNPLEHAVAYHRARVYHGTDRRRIEGDAESEGIAKTGLLTSQSGTGASKLDPLYSNQSQRKIHVGLSRGVSSGYGTVIRPVLPANRAVVNPEPRLKENYVDYEEVPANQKPQLTRDPHHRGGGATTEADIPPNQIILGSNSQLLSPTSEAEQQRKEGVLRAIGSNYGSDDLGDLEKRHREALEEGYISD